MTLRPTPNPPLLLMAAALLALQGLLLLGYAVLEMAHLSAERVAVAVTTSVFFAGYAVLLLLCAVALLRGRSWARSPAVLTQLIWLGVAWSFRGGETTPIAAGLAGVAILVLIGLLAPSSLAALDGGTDQEAGPEPRHRPDGPV